MLPTVDVSYVDAVSCGLPLSEIDKVGAAVAGMVGYKRSRDLEEIVQQLGGRIVYQTWDEWSHSNADEIIVDGYRDFTIYLSSLSGPLRDRFTIAHELGHYFLHSDMGDKRIRVRRQGSERVEVEANRFAAGFLMPEDEFRKIAGKEPVAGQLAAEFQVSTAAAKVRLESLGIH